MYKKGVSDIISTVLLILITIVAISILAFILIPFTQNNLEESKNCIDVKDKINIVRDNKKTCYDNNALESKITIKVSNIDIDGIYIVGENSGSTSFEIIGGSSFPEINDGTPLLIPQGGGGEKTYTINSNYREIRAGALIRGKRCPNPDVVELEVCL